MLVCVANIPEKELITCTLVVLKKRSRINCCAKQYSFQVVWLFFIVVIKQVKENTIF
jgi:hypothetical protein